MQRSVRRGLQKGGLLTASVQVGIVLFAVLWLVWIVNLIQSDADRSLPRMDFKVFYSVSSLVLDGRPEAAYNRELLATRDAELTGDSYVPWTYPPPALLLFLPLSVLPFGAAFAVWGAATASVLLTAIRRLSGSPTALGLAFLFPSTLFNLFTGQNGLLTAGLFAWGMVLLNRRPGAAGLVLGALVFKPHLFPLVPLALLAGGCRRAFLATCASAAGFALLSLAAFGPGAWEGFIAMIPQVKDMLYDGTYSWWQMQSVTATLLELGVPPEVTQAAQALFGLAAVCSVTWLWWRKDVLYEYKVAGLALAILAVTPYAFHYDLTILGVGMLWFASGARRRGLQGWERAALAFTFFAPILSVMIGRETSISGGPAVFLILLAVLANRIRLDLSLQPVRQSQIMAAA